MKAKTQGSVLCRPAPARQTQRVPGGHTEFGFCFSCSHVVLPSRKEMLFVSEQKSRWAVGGVIFKKTRDGMEKETKVRRESREDA